MKDYEAMSPREVEAELREAIRKSLGDKVENKAIVNASRGYFYVEIHEPVEYAVRFRRKNIGRVIKSIRALK